MNELERVLAALVVGASEHEAIGTGTQKVTIRSGFRDYAISDRLIVAFEKTGLFGRTRIVAAEQMILRDVTSASLVAAGLPDNIPDAVIALQEFYPLINSGSEVTVIAFGAIVMPEIVNLGDQERAMPESAGTDNTPS